MNNDIKQLTSPEKVAEAGEALYREKHQKDFERDHMGQFAVVDITTGRAYVAEFAEQALQKARADSELGLFHLIRIGAPGAFRVSYSHGNRSGTLRQAR